MSKKATPFKTEADLCAAFMATVKKEWLCYPETGFDILLVRITDGVQIGIEAKLKLNVAVLLQAVEPRWGGYVGPDYRAVLVPECSHGGLEGLARCCGLVVLTSRPDQVRHGIAVWPPLPRSDGQIDDDGAEWIDRMPQHRCKLPEYIPDVVAGAPAPIQLTEWKVKALKIAVLLDRTGYVTRDDFKRLRIDVRRWIEERWLTTSPAGLVAGPRMPPFRVQHPVVWDQIVADAKGWQRPTPFMVTSPSRHDLFMEPRK